MTTKSSSSRRRNRSQEYSRTMILAWSSFGKISSTPSRSRYCRYLFIYLFIYLLQRAPDVVKKQRQRHERDFRPSQVKTQKGQDQNTLYSVTRANYYLRANEADRAEEERDTRVQNAEKRRESFDLCIEVERTNWFNEKWHDEFNLIALSLCHWISLTMMKSSFIAHASDDFDEAYVGNDQYERTEKRVGAYDE